MLHIELLTVPLTGSVSASSKLHFLREYRHELYRCVSGGVVVGLKQELLTRCSRHFRISVGTDSFFLPFENFYMQKNTNNSKRKD